MPKPLDEARARADSIEGLLSAHLAASERIAGLLATGFDIPVIQQMPWVVKAQNWTVLIPAQRTGYSVYISGVWFTTDTQCNVGFGQGSTSVDSGFFPSTQITGGLAAGNGPGCFPVAQYGGFSQTKDPWVYRTDPGLGFAVFCSSATAIVAGHIVWYPGEVNTGTVADYSSLPRLNAE